MHFCFGAEPDVSLLANQVTFQVTAVNLRDGSQLLANMVVVGIGIRPNTSLFEGQLTLEKGGIKVNEKLQTKISLCGWRCCTFPVKLFGETRRLELVDSARKSAKHAVAEILEREKTGEFDYLPFFYSRVFCIVLAVLWGTMRERQYIWGITRGVSLGLTG